MSDAHWFDHLHRSLVHDAPRRGLFRAVGAFLAGLAVNGATRPGVAKKKKKKKGGKKKGKGKGKGKGSGNTNPNPTPPARCGEAACMAEWPDDEYNRNECELKCGRCRIQEKFCIVEGDPNIPDNVATCCYENQSCCDDAGSQSGKRCVDTGSDINHCGACKKRCTGDTICVRGRCLCPFPHELTECGGACVNTNSDPAHCGECDSPCPEGWLCCRQTCYDPATSTTNCGRCGNDCGNGSCVEGQCQQPCPPGTKRCGTSTSCEPDWAVCCGNTACGDPEATCCPGPGGVDYCWWPNTPCDG